MEVNFSRNIKMLQQTPKALGERAAVLAWALGAVSFVALAASAIQMPGSFTGLTENLPKKLVTLPPSGPVTTTASVANPQNQFEVYLDPALALDRSKLEQTQADLRELKKQMTSMRRNLMHLQEQNRRISMQISEANEKQSASVTKANPALKVKRPAPKPAPARTLPKNVRKIETLPAPLVIQEPTFEPVLTPQKVSYTPQSAPVVLPRAKALQVPTTGSISKVQAPKSFQLTPAAGTLSSSGRNRIRRTEFAIQLGLETQKSTLTELKAKLEKRNATLLKSLLLKIAQVQTEGVARYQLLAGPFPNAADTAVVCARLRQEKVNCETTFFH